MKASRGGKSGEAVSLGRIAGPIFVPADVLMNEGNYPHCAEDETEARKDRRCSRSH